MTTPSLSTYAGTWSIRGTRLGIELRVTARGVNLHVSTVLEGSHDGRWAASFPDDGSQPPAENAEDIQLIEGGAHGRLAFMARNYWTPALRQGCCVDLEEGMWALLAITIPSALNMIEPLRAISDAVSPPQWLEDYVRTASLGVLVDGFSAETAVDVAFPERKGPSQSAGPELDQELNNVRARTLTKLQQLCSATLVTEDHGGA